MKNDIRQALIPFLVSKDKTFFKNEIYKFPSHWQENINDDENDKVYSKYEKNIP